MRSGIIIVIGSLLGIVYADGCDSISLKNDKTIVLSEKRDSTFNIIYSNIEHYFERHELRVNFNPSRINLPDDSLCVIEALKSGFGGYFLYVVFKDHFKEIYRLWAYEIEGSVYEIREQVNIKVENSECLEKQFVSSN